MTFDRMVNYHRLDNLIWVWNANAPNGKNAGPYYDFYPGAQYVDILAADIYGEFEQSHHDDPIELAKGKPMSRVVRERPRTRGRASYSPSTISTCQQSDRNDGWKG
jgi:hypothetical protein